MDDEGIPVKFSLGMHDDYYINSLQVWPYYTPSNKENSPRNVMNVQHPRKVLGLK